MKNNIIISIVTVVYNAEDTIEKTIKSVNNQTYKNIEYIVIDGFSKDKTWDIVIKNKKKINKCVQVKDSGIYDAMNQSLKYCSGEYVYFLNSGDTFYDNNVIYDIVKELCEDNKLPEMIYGGIIHKNPIPGVYSQKVKNRSFSIKELSEGKTINHQALMIKKQTIEELNGFNILYKLSADFDMECKIFKSSYYRIKYINRIVIKFYGGGASSKLWNVYFEKIRIIKNHFGIYKSLKYRINRGLILIIINILNSLNILNPFLKIIRYSTK